MDPESSERQIVLFPSPAWRDKTGETRAFEHFLTTDDSMRSLSLHFSVDHILRPPLHDASNPILLLHYSDSSPRINANRPPWEMSAGGNNSVLKWRERERKREKKWIKREMLSISSWQKLSYEENIILEKCYFQICEIDPLKFRLLMRQV